MSLITFTTLSTPHDGTRAVLSALGADWEQSIPFERLFSRSRLLDLDELRDLNPNAVRLASGKWGNKPHDYPIGSSTNRRTSAYFSVSPDADGNGNNQIDPSEANGFSGKISSPLLVASANAVWAAAGGQWSCRLRVDFPGSNVLARLTNALPIQCLSIRPNDIVVTKESARGGAAFTQAEAALGQAPLNFSFNHNTVLDTTLAARLLLLMRRSEPMQ